MATASGPARHLADLAGRFLAARHHDGRAVPAGRNAGPSSLTDAYRLQNAHRDALIEDGRGRVVGYKIGATSVAGQRHLALDGPFFAPLLSSAVGESPARLRGGDFRHRLVEVEIAVRLGRDLRSATPDPEEIVDAIATVMPAIEIADSRYADWTIVDGRDAIADLGFAGHWIQGRDCDAWRGLDLSELGASLQVDGAEVSRGTGRDVLGGPLVGIQRLAAHLASQGTWLRAGEIVTTGSMTPVFVAPPRANLRATIERLGHVEVQLA